MFCLPFVHLKILRQRFQLTALWESPPWYKNTILLLLIKYYFTINTVLHDLLSKEMGTNVFLEEAASNKLPKKHNFRCAKLSVICRQH